MAGQCRRERLLAVENHEHPAVTGGAIRLGHVILIDAYQHHAAEIRPPRNVEFGQKPPPAEKAAAHGRARLINAAAFFNQMDARHARRLLEFRRVDLGRHAARLAGAANSFRRFHRSSSRLVALSISSSSRAMNSRRFNPAGIGSRNSTLMVPGYFQNPCQKRPESSATGTQDTPNWP